VTSKPDFKVMVLLLVFMQLTRDLFAIAKFLLFLVFDFQSETLMSLTKKLVTNLGMVTTSTVHSILNNNLTCMIICN